MAIAWLVWVSAMSCGCVAFGLGSNIFAIAWGPIIGAQGLSYWKCAVMAATCESVGVLLLGPEFTDASYGILRLGPFQTFPAMVVICGAVIPSVTAVALNLFSYWGIPLSPSQLTVAATLGAALPFVHTSGIIWGIPGTRAFPYVSGVANKLLAPLVPPLWSAIWTALIFMALRDGLLRRPNALRRTVVALPLLLAGVWVLVICTCNGIWGYARTAKTNFLGLTGIKITALACCTAITGLCISIMAFTPLLSKWTQSAMVGKSLKEKGMHLEMEEWVIRMQEYTTAHTRSHTKSVLSILRRLCLLTDDMQVTIATQRGLTALHASAEHFAPHSEDCFQPLMIIMAMVLSIAQGGAVSAVAVAPLSAAQYALQHGSITSKIQISLNHRMIAAVGVALGAILGGRFQARTIGVRLVHFSPARCLAFLCATGIARLSAGQINLAVTHTYLHIASTLMIGVLERRHGFNGRLFLKLLACYLISWPAVLATSACLIWLCLAWPDPYAVPGNDFRSLCQDLLSFLEQENRTASMMARTVAIANATRQLPHAAQLSAILTAYLNQTSGT